MTDNKDPESDGLFNFKKYWGPNEYRSRIVFERNTNMRCVYCGEDADSREHCPSKAFLSKPYPLDLPIVPACQKCNNGYSQDELYVKSFIDLFKAYSLGKKLKVDFARKEVRDAKEKFDYIIEKGEIEFDSRIERIIIKLTICHAAFELTEGYYSDDWNGIPEFVSYTFRPNMTIDEIASYDKFIYMNDKILPIVGSRVFDNIYVVQPVLMSTDKTEALKAPLALMTWSDIQNENYRYICWFEQEKLCIRIVIDEFLFAKVVFKPIME